MNKQVDCTESGTQISQPKMSPCGHVSLADTSTEQKENACIHKNAVATVTYPSYESANNSGPSDESVNRNPLKAMDYLDKNRFVTT